MLRAFGFDRYDIYLSTRPEKYAGDARTWDLAESALRKALERKGLPFEVDRGRGVFYGPKIDIKIKDMLGRSWQCSTIQVDFNNPERFDATYVADDGTPRRAIMIHRALMGSLERFFGVLVEHYAGAFPMWLAPVQADVLAVTDQQNDYAREVVATLAPRGSARRAISATKSWGTKSGNPRYRRFRMRSSSESARRKRRSPRGDGEGNSSPPWESRRSSNSSGAKPSTRPSKGGRHRQGIPNQRADPGPGSATRGRRRGAARCRDHAEALQQARVVDLDLVEVAPMAAPPVCRIMDYGKFKYILSKREQEARKKQTVIQVKEIKVRPKTEEHDINTKLKHIRRFLEDGDKVKVTVRFRGRELAYASQSGFEVLKHIVDAIADIAKVESAPKMEGKTMMAIVAPTMHKKKPVVAAKSRRRGQPHAAAPKPAPRRTPCRRRPAAGAETGGIGHAEDEIEPGREQAVSRDGGGRDQARQVREEPHPDLEGPEAETGAAQVGPGARDEREVDPPPAAVPLTASSDQQRRKR